MAAAVPAEHLWISVADTALLFALLAIGMGLVMGIAGQVNLAQIAFFGVGAYVTAILTTHDGYGFWTAAVLAMAATVAVVVVVGAPALRIQSHYLGIVTLGLAVAFIDWITNSPVTGGDSGISGIRRRRCSGSTCPASTCITTWSFWSWRPGWRSGCSWCARRGVADAGHAGRPAGGGPSAAEIPVLRMTAFVLASVYGGIAGVLYAGLIHYIAPETFSIANMFLLLAMVIIGGRQTLAGCVIGAIGLTVVQQELVNLAAYAQLGYGLLVVLMVIFAPTGLVGIPARVARAAGRCWGRDGPAALEQFRLLPAGGGGCRGGGRPRRLGAVILEVSDLSKRFRGVTAVDAVSLSVSPRRDPRRRRPERLRQDDVVQRDQRPLPPIGPPGQPARP